MNALHISCPAKRTLARILYRCAPLHEREAWLQDAVDAGAFTQDEAAVIRLAMELAGERHGERVNG